MEERLRLIELRFGISPRMVSFFLRFLLSVSHVIGLVSGLEGLRPGGSCALVHLIRSGDAGNLTPYLLRYSGARTQKEVYRS
jgi:hypothetical protein